MISNKLIVSKMFARIDAILRSYTYPNRKVEFIAWMRQHFAEMAAKHDEPATPGGEGVRAAVEPENTDRFPPSAKNPHCPTSVDTGIANAPAVVQSVAVSERYTAPSITVALPVVEPMESAEETGKPVAASECFSEKTPDLIFHGEHGWPLVSDLRVEGPCPNLRMVRASINGEPMNGGRLGKMCSMWSGGRKWRLGQVVSCRLDRAMGEHEAVYLPEGERK